MDDAPSATSARPRPPRWIAIVAASLVLAASDIAHDVVRRLPPSFAGVVFRAGGTLAALAVLTVVFDVCQRRRVPAGATFALAFTVASSVMLGEVLLGKVIYAGTGTDLVGGLQFHQGAWRTTSEALTLGAIALGVWAVAVVFPFAVRDSNARAIEAERLRTLAELARLRAHLQPHFLLNTLNTISGLAGEDPEEARRLIGALGDLLRDSLEEAEETQTLEAEVTWLRRYAEILETRHRGMLTFRWEIAEATRGVRVPRLLLQPLVENAVKHGALRRREGAGGEVVVTTSIGEDRRIRCVVEDNGPGPSTKAPRPDALGIQLVTKRLALRYADAAMFRLESGEGRTRSIVELPAEVAP